MRAVEWLGGSMAVVDQSALPDREERLVIGTVDDLVDAISRLRVRGALTLGAAGALGVALAVHQGRAAGWDDRRLAAEIDRIRRARPTAVNLARGVEDVLPALPLGAAAVEAAALDA